MELKEVLEQQMGVLTQMRTRLEEVEKKVKDGNAPPSELKEAVDKHQTALDKFESWRVELETKMNRPAAVAGDEQKVNPSEVKRHQLMDRLLRKGWGSDEEKQARELLPQEFKVMSESDLSTGGAFVFPEYVADVVRRIVLISPIREMANVRSTSSDRVIVPVETGDFQLTWPQEGATRTETSYVNALDSTKGPLGTETVYNHEAFALVLLTNQEIEDSAVNVESFVAERAAKRFARGEGTKFISGNGVGCPFGFMSDARVGVAASGGIDYTPGGDTSTLTKGDALVTLAHSLPTQYAQAAIWAFTRATLGVIRTLKDGVGRWIFEPSLVPGNPNAILGSPYKECPDMPEIATNAYPIIFADWKTFYTISDRIQMNVLRLVEKYSDSGCIGLQFRKRVGGKVIMPQAAAKLKIATA